MCAVYTTEDLAVPFERMVKALMGDFEAITDYVTKGVDKLEDAWEDVEDAAGDVIAEIKDAPNADVDIDPNVAEPDTVMELSADGSTEPDGEDLTYQWYLIEKPAASSLGDVGHPIENYTDSIAYLTFDAVGTYEVAVTVTNESGKSDTAYGTMICKVEE
jgi:hypothetical protein